MEIEKVIRILTLFVVAAAFIIKTATCLLFPEASHATNLPIAIALILALVSIWHEPFAKENKNSNR